MKKEGFAKEYIKSDAENDFTRNMRSGYYYSKEGVCAYEMSGTILIALFWKEIKGRLGTLEKALTCNHTRTNGYLGLDNMITGAKGI